MKVVISENKVLVLAYKWLDDNYGDMKWTSTGAKRRIYYNVIGETILALDRYSDAHIYDLILSDSLRTAIMGLFGYDKPDANATIEGWFRSRYLPSLWRGRIRVK